MTEILSLPLIGKHRRKYLATCFGSPTGRVSDIADPFNRRRCEARIAFEESYSRLYDSETRRACPTGADYAACMKRAADSLAEDEYFHRNELKRPARLRSHMSAFLEPFGENEWMPLDDYCDSPALDKPRALRVIVPDARKRYTALVFGADDESPNGVPAEAHERYDLAMRAELEHLEVMREQVAQHYGALSGDVADIPAANRATASRSWRRFMARFEARCEFELELTRIYLDEQRAEREAEEAERKAEEVIDGVERQVENAAHDILREITAEQR